MLRGSFSLFGRLSIFSITLSSNYKLSTLIPCVFHLLLPINPTVQLELAHQVGSSTREKPTLIGNQ
jgi:hypothetical protein